MLHRNEKVALEAGEVAEFVGNPVERFGVPRSVLNDGAPKRVKLLERISRIRQGTDPAPRDTGMGKVALSWPEFDYYVCMHRFPELNSRDAEIRLKATRKFMASPVSEPYKVSKTDGKRLPWRNRGGLLVPPEPAPKPPPQLVV